MTQLFEPLYIDEHLCRGCDRPGPTHLRCIEREPLPYDNPTWPEDVLGEPLPESPPITHQQRRAIIAKYRALDAVLRRTFIDLDSPAFFHALGLWAADRLREQPPDAAYDWYYYWLGCEL